jgi:hypothetical protein
MSVLEFGSGTNTANSDLGVLVPNYPAYPAKPANPSYITMPCGISGHHFKDFDLSSFSRLGAKSPNHTPAVQPGLL